MFVRAGQQIITEYDGGGLASSPERKYLYCSTCYIDEPIALIDDASGGDIYYYHRDRSYNIIGLTDDTGSIVELYAYTLYGERTIFNASWTAITASAFGNQRGFQGLRHDPETGLIENRARMLDPKAGRFVQRDPLGYPDGMNSYAAYHVMWGGVDPYGQLSIVFRRTPGYINKKLAGAHGQAFASVSITATCVKCSNTEDSKRCWMYEDLTVAIVGTIYMDEGDFDKKRKTKKGKFFLGIYGHEQEHIDKYEEAYDDTILDRLKKKLLNNNSQIFVNEGECIFKTKENCENYVDRYGASMETILSKDKKIIEAIANAGKHAEDEGAPEGAPGEEEEVAPTDNAPKQGDYPKVSHPGDDINNLQ